jgi:hypothetical protein
MVWTLTTIPCVRTAVLIYSNAVCAASRISVDDKGGASGYVDALAEDEAESPSSLVTTGRGMMIVNRCLEMRDCSTGRDVRRTLVLRMREVWYGRMFNEGWAS